ANQGQVDRAVRFVARGAGYTLFLTESEAVLSLAKSPAQADAGTPPPGRSGESGNTLLRMKLVGLSHGQRMVGAERLPGTVNYLVGNDSTRWRTNIPTYAKVRHKSVYPGVDLVYHGTHGRLEYDFVLAPGANLDAIALDFDGADALEVDREGDLIMRTVGGEVRLQKPLVYQDVGSQRTQITGEYLVKSRNRVGFRVAAYDTTKPLVIDPVLVYATYVGGSKADRVLAMAADDSGN